jgi:glucosylceramidase
LSFGTVPSPGTPTIQVDESQTFQEIDGFGAALTDSSAWLLGTRLDPATRATIMARLFDPLAGIGLSYVRLPMGASDFALSNYTYDDLPAGQTDPSLTSFSIDHDRAYILPVLKQALALSPRLKVMGSPWSAPAWMKTSNSLFGGSLEPAAYPAYAAYFARFVQAYTAEGVPIDAVTVQNEPHVESASYPSMRLEPAEAATFVRDDLGPAFARAGIGTKLVVWDHNWDEPAYPISVLDDAGARPYLAGSAFQCYAGDVTAQSTVQVAYPGKDIYSTECSGGGWSTDFGTNLRWDMRNLVIGATRNWARTVLFWNLALDSQSGPQNGGCANCRGVITLKSASAVTYHVEYYALGHASKFVAPGAHRIASTGGVGTGLQHVAFRNMDGSKALLVLNDGAGKQAFAVAWGGRAFSTTLPAGAVATFTWTGAPQ